MNRIFRRKYTLYVCLCIAMLPIIMLRDYTPSNELRYLSIADEALRNHTFFTFYNHGEIYADKPPLYFWALMLCKYLFGEYKMWILALFSFIPALDIMQVMDNWVKEELDSEHRSLARLMLLSSGLFLSTSVFLRMDMLMTLFIVLALREFWRMYNSGSQHTRSHWLFPVYMFLAIFTKGPFGLLIPLCATLAFLVAKKQIKRVGLFWGWQTWGILALLCTGWFVGIYAEGGKEYLNNLLVHQTVGRAVNSFHHKEAFYYYLLHIWYCAAPWSILSLGMMVVSLRLKTPKSDLLRFFQTSFMATFILLSCISAKLQIYILPAIPFLIYVTVMFLPRLDKSRWLELSLAIPATIFVLALPVIFIISSPEEVFQWGGIWICAAVIILSGCGLHVLWLMYGNQQKASIEQVVFHLGIGLLLAVFIGGWGMPCINNDISYGTLCKKASRIAEEQKITDFRTWHIIRSENMDVYLHHPVRIISDDSIPNKDSKGSYLLITRKRYLPLLSTTGKTQMIGQYAIVTFEK